MRNSQDRQPLLARVLPAPLTLALAFGLLSLQGCGARKAYLRGRDIGAVEGCRACGPVDMTTRDLLLELPPVEPAKTKKPRRRK